MKMNQPEVKAKRSRQPDAQPPLSATDGARRHAGVVGLVAYSQAWRDETTANGTALASDSDWAELRDQGHRPTPDLA